MSAKQERLNLRATNEQKRLLEEAAKISKQTVSAFVLDAASHAAHRLVADQTSFALSEEAWQKFTAALDGPPVDRPRLRRFLETPSVLES